MALQVIAKHNLSILQDGKAILLGVLYSLADSVGRAISANLVIQYASSWDKEEKVSNISRDNMDSFLFSLPNNKPAYDEGGKVSRYIQHLKDNPDKVGIVYLDSKGTKGYLSCCSPLNEASMKSKGFICYVSNSSNSSNSTSSSVANAFVSSSYTTAKSSDIPASNEINASKKRGLEQMQAADHYNLNLSRVRNDRHHSYIYHLRELNNWIKNTLIETTLRQVTLKKKSAQRTNGDVNTGVTVLDLGCGMGGDLMKWLRGSNHTLNRYVGVDIAINSLKHFITERLIAQFPGELHKFPKFICADMGVESLTSSVLPTHTWKGYGSNSVGTWNDLIPLIPSDMFDIASCQFAIHYMFQTKAKAAHFLSEVSRHLHEGGLFIATTIDIRVVTDMIIEDLAGEQDDSDNNGSSSHKELVIKNDLNDMLLKLSFTDESWKRLIVHNDDSAATATRSDDDAFGIQYDFSLLDSDSSKAVNAPEWLVPSGRVLDDLCRQHQLVLLKNQNCHDYVHEGLKDDSMRKRMEDRGAFNYKGTISNAEWKICRLYTVLVFEKRQSMMVEPSSPSSPPPSDDMPASPTSPPPDDGDVPTSPTSPPPDDGDVPVSPTSPPPPC